MSLLFNAPDLTTLWHEANSRLLFAKADQLDWAAGATTGINDNLLQCDSMEFDFDVSDLWLTKHRFTKLQRDYLDYEILNDWINGPCTVQKMPRNLSRRGTVTGYSCRVHGVKSHGGRKDNYTWGNCIQGFTFRPIGEKDEKQRGIFTMHSRTSYICYMAGLDLALCYTIAKKIAEVRGEDVKDYGFRWHIDSLQWYSIKAMAYVHNYDLIDQFNDRKKYPDKEYPSAKITRNSYEFLQKRKRENNPPKYGPTHRVWELMFDEDRRPYSTPVDDLELEMYK